MQNNIVMAFRKRLKKRGYLKISILSCPQHHYIIKAIEPLSGVQVNVMRDLSWLANSFR